MQTDVRVAPGHAGRRSRLTLEVGQLTETVNVVEQLGTDQHADGDGLVDAERRSAQPDADADAQRAERGHVPAGRQHARHQPRLDDQRPAGIVPQHHARRRQQQRQLPALDRLVLRLGHAAPGRGRGGHGDDWPRPGAQVGGSGAVSINFTTRSGTNLFSGSVYEYYRDPTLNTNYWFNERNDLPKNDVKLNQYGGRVGGPIVIPGLYDGRDKAFFFAHYEQLRFPNSFTRTRTVLQPARARRLLPLHRQRPDPRGQRARRSRRANGQISAPDPIDDVAAQRRSTRRRKTTGTRHARRSDPLINDYVWQSPGKLFEHQPTLQHRLQPHRQPSADRLVRQIIWAERDPDYLNSADVRFPGAPNYRDVQLEAAAASR